MIELAFSILASDFAHLADEVKTAERGGGSIVHIDVMDGHFVPNITFGPPMVQALRSVTNLPLDCHLMIERPDEYIPAFAEAGADLVSVHQEVCRHLHRTLQLIGDHGMLPGVVINPATPVDTLIEVLPMVHYVLVMSVNPGFGGQKFLPLADPPEPEIASVEHVIYVIRDSQPEALMRAIAGLAPDFTVKLGRRPNFDIADPANSPFAGYLWTNARAAGLTVANYGVFVRNGQAIDPAAKSYTKPDASTLAADLNGAMPRLIIVQIASDDALAALKNAVAKSRYASKTEIVVGDLRRVEALLDLRPMTRKD